MGDRARVRWFTAASAGLVCALTATLAPGGAATAAPSAPEEFRVFTSNGSDTAAAARNLVEMNLMPSTDNGYVPDTRPPLRDDAKACPPARCRDYTLKIPASVKVTRPVVRVLLPVDYARRPNRRYPVVYMYNGAKSPYYRWSRATEITSMSRNMQAIFVMPEGGYGDEAGFFSDWKDGSYDWETFHVKYVIPWVDRKFRTIRGGRAAMGASMGSLGALNYAARHPGLFKAVFSLSGIVDTTTLSANGLPPAVGDTLGLEKPSLDRVWGNPLLDRATWSANNPIENVEAFKKTKLFISSGTGFPQYDPNDQIHSGIVEQVLWNTHRPFLAALTAAGVPYQARISVGGFHDWPYFHEPMKWGIPKIIAAARR